MVKENLPSAYVTSTAPCGNHTALGRDFDPEFFDLRELQNRVDDFQRVIGEARWGFYHK